jgi:hypothetical protein
MTEKTKNRLLAAGGYIWRLLSLAAVFIGAVISIPFVFDAYFGHDIEHFREQQNIENGDFLFLYPDNLRDSFNESGTLRSVDLSRMRLYYQTEYEIGYNDLIPVEADSPEEYAAEATEKSPQGYVSIITYAWDGNAEIPFVYAIADTDDPEHIDVLLIKTADGQLLRSNKEWHTI